jgi:hypothetical protein
MVSPRCFLDHRAALDVPAGAAFAGAARAGPFHFAVFRGLVGFPEGEIGDGILVIGVGNGVGDLELALLDAREAAVAGEGVDLEIHGAVGGAIGITFLHQALDHAHLLGNVARGGGLDVGTQAVQRVAVGVELVGPLFCDLGERAFLLLGLADGAVVDVGEVADVLHLVLAELELEEAAEDIVDDEGAEIADVGGGVNRRAAVVEAENAVGLGGLEFAEAAGEGFVEPDGHWEVFNR